MDEISLSLMINNLCFEVTALDIKIKALLSRDGTDMLPASITKLNVSNRPLILLTL